MAAPAERKRPAEAPLNVVSRDDLDVILSDLKKEKRSRTDRAALASRMLSGLRKHDLDAANDSGGSEAASGA